MKNVITIARAFGSGGAEVGRRVASRLGFYYADRQLLYFAAKRLHLSDVEVAMREERIQSLWERIRDSFAMATLEGNWMQSLPHPISDEELFAEERSIMRLLASRHDCVIVGRGARFVFRDHPCAVHVLLHSPIAYRVRRVMDAGRIGAEEEAIQKIEEYDQERTVFRRKMTKEDPTQAQNYNLCIDTGGIPLESVADIIIAYYQARLRAEGRII
jgi:cytidylate kinase